MSSQAKMFEHMLRRLLANQRLSRSVVVEQEEWIQALPRSHQKEPQVNGKMMASRVRQSLTLGTLTSTSIYDKVESLDVPLDDPTGFAVGSWWMIGCKCVIHEWNKLRLGPLVPWGQWEWLRSNTERKEHIQVRISSKWCNQRYGQSNTIKAIQQTTQSKQYD